MTAANAIRALTRRISSACSSRIGDCIGMMVAGAIFVALAPRVEFPEAFRQPGLCMVAAGAVFTFVGLRRRWVR